MHRSSMAPYRRGLSATIDLQLSAHHCSYRRALISLDYTGQSAKAAVLAAKATVDAVAAEQDSARRLAESLQQCRADWGTH